MKTKSNKFKVQMKLDAYKTEVTNEVKAKLMDKVFDWQKKIAYDCVLAADGKVLKAHQKILAASSLYLKEIFSMNINANNVSSIVLVPESKYEDMVALMSLIYEGKAQITANQIEGIQKIAKTLQVPIGDLAEKLQPMRVEQMKEPEKMKPEQAASDELNVIKQPLAKEKEAETDLMVEEASVVKNQAMTSMSITETPRSSRVPFSDHIEASEDENDIMFITKPDALNNFE